MILNQDKNKNKLNSKSRSWDKKNNNKNMTHVKQESTKIFSQGRYKNKTNL